MAFSIFFLAFVFSPFHLFSFFIAFFIIYLAAVRRREKILKAQRLPKGEDVCMRCWFSLPSTLFLSYCRCKRPLWFFPHQRTIDATWCIMLKSLVNPLISVLLKTDKIGSQAFILFELLLFVFAFHRRHYCYGIDYLTERTLTSYKLNYVIKQRGSFLLRSDS